MPTPAEVLQKLDALKATHARAVSSRAVAQSQYDQAQNTVKKAEATLVEMGIDPANAEAELRRAIADLDTQIETVSGQIAERMTEYSGISEAFKKVGA